MAKSFDSILNELIETSKDGENGFRKAAQDARDPQLKSLFTTCAQRCADGARELQQVVRANGGDPEKSGSVAAALHRGWISLKESVASRDDKAILEEVERGEDYAKAQYRKALEQEGWSRTEASRRLGVTPRSLRYLMRKHGLSDPPISDKN